MDKINFFKTLFTDPFSVLKDGVMAQTEKNFKKVVKSNYNLEQLPTIDFLDLFPGINDNVNNYSFLSGTSLVTDMLLLKNLARAFEGCVYLEIGSWRGESISNVSEVAKECISITLSAEEMRALGISEDFIKCHGIFSKGIKNITTFEHNSQTFDFSKLNKKFDLIFIDGDHSYKGVLNDTKKVFSLRKNEKSIIVWHDYGTNTEEVRHSVLKAILDGIPKEKHHNLYHVSNTLCAIYIEGKSFNTKFTKFPSMPDKKFSLLIKGDRI